MSGRDKLGNPLSEDTCLAANGITTILNSGEEVSVARLYFLADLYNSALLLILLLLD